MPEANQDTYCISDTNHRVCTPEWGDHQSLESVERTMDAFLSDATSTVQDAIKTYDGLMQAGRPDARLKLVLIALTGDGQTW